MRKNMTNYILAALSLAGALFLSSCQKESNAPKEDGKVYYSVSILASIAGENPDTRAISYNDVLGGLEASFETTDKIYVVYQYYHPIAETIWPTPAEDHNKVPLTLRPKTNGATTTLTGQLYFIDQENEELYYSVNLNDALVLLYNSMGLSYENQPGTLSSLSRYDQAMATVYITAINGSGTDADPYTLTTSKATFENSQSMYKFTFTGLPVGVGVKSVTIHSDKGKLLGTYSPSEPSGNLQDVTINLESTDTSDGYANGDERRIANGEGVVYAALSFWSIGASETDDITFTVTGTDNKTYSKTKTSPVGGFQNGKYYTSSIALTPTN